MIDALSAVFVDPFVAMSAAPIFLLEVIVSGVAAGMMYALVALGFVLIFKASGVFNFAQGVMALFAALTLTGVMDVFGVPAPVAILITVGVMIGLAWLIEWGILRRLVNQEPIVLFMSTLGLAYILEGVGDILWGSDVKVLDIGLPQGANAFLLDGIGLYVDNLEIVAAVSAGVMVAVLAVFFNRTRIGRALRAVADDHQAALSVGISLSTIWFVVWSVSGAVALTAGIMWGAKSGVQFSLSLIALKALPVLILGGLTSIPGAIVGGVIVGVGEKLAEVYWGGLIGGAIENWFAYILALIFLMFRPQGLFGERIIERV